MEDWKAKHLQETAIFNQNMYKTFEALRLRSILNSRNAAMFYQIIDHGCSMGIFSTITFHLHNNDDRGRINLKDYPGVINLLCDYHKRYHGACYALMRLNVYEEDTLSEELEALAMGNEVDYQAAFSKIHNLVKDMEPYNFGQKRPKVLSLEELQQETKENWDWFYKRKEKYGLAQEIVKDKEVKKVIEPSSIKNQDLTYPQAKINLQPILIMCIILNIISIIFNVMKRIS